MKNLDQLFATLLELVQNTSNFVNAETPEFIRQLLEYRIWECQFVIWSLAIVTSIFVLLCIISFIIECRTSDDPVISVVFMIFSIVLITFSSIFIPKSIREMKKIEIAPKVFIVEYLTNKIKQ